MKTQFPNPVIQGMLSWDKGGKYESAEWVLDILRLRWLSNNWVDIHLAGSNASLDF